MHLFAVVNEFNSPWYEHKKSKQIQPFHKPQWCVKPYINHVGEYLSVFARASCNPGYNFFVCPTMWEMNLGYIYARTECIKCCVIIERCSISPLILHKTLLRFYVIGFIHFSLATFLQPITISKPRRENKFKGISQIIWHDAHLLSENPFCHNTEWHHFYVQGKNVLNFQTISYFLC